MFSTKHESLLSPEFKLKELHVYWKQKCYLDQWRHIRTHRWQCIIWDIKRQVWAPIPLRLINGCSIGFEVLYGKIATDAFHDSGERFDPPKCHPNTRVAVLAEIMQWIKSIEGSEDILWLYGPAGAGKSAIAQTIAEMCAKLGLIVASFFFARASQSRNNEKRLIPSIAYQLILSIPSTRSYIESAIQMDLAIFDKSLETQIETLIIRPLENACADVDPAVVKQWPRLIIVDGLDECDGPSIQCSIIRLLSKAFRRVPLILLVASRPEQHIRNTFNLLTKSKSHVSRHIVLDESYKPDVDIKEFLVSRFKEIKENHHLATFISESWPSEGIVNRLVRKSSGQFIYASTVMKYLDSPKHRPMRRLDVIMGLRPVEGDMPYKELDALYSHILSCVEDIHTTLKMLKFLFFGRDGIFRHPRILAVSVGLDEEDVYLHFSELHSILHIPPPNTKGPVIRPTHASLQDFLVDKLRSGKYYLDEEAFHTDLALQGVRQISTLPMDQALQRSFGPENYALISFTRHCSCASTESADLKNYLMQLRDLRPWLDTGLDVDHLPFFFEWLYKVCYIPMNNLWFEINPYESQADSPAKELSNHIQSLWDQYLTTKLSEHTFNGSNVDIAGLLFFPPDWGSCWFYLISGISKVPDIFEPHYLSYNVAYRRFLSTFFEDKKRSGRYHVDGTVYAHAALQCFRNMFNLNDG